MVKQDVRVKQSIRKGKLVKGYVRKQNKKNTALKAAIGAASVLGVSAATYLVLKKRYIDGYKKSAEWALNASKNINTDNLSNNIKRIHFATGGFSAKSKEAREGLSFARKLKDVLDKSQEHIIPIDTSASNVKFLGRDYKNNFEFAKDGLVGWVKPFIKQGYNPTSREIAAKMYAYSKKYPDKDLVLHGFSSGSFVNSEAVNIFKTMGGDVKKIKQVNYVGTYLGINKINPNNTLSLASKDDWDNTAKLLNYPNTQWIPGKTQHTISEYLEDKSVTDKIKEFIGYKPKPLVKTKSANTPTSESVNDEIKLLLERKKKLDAVRKNDKIPAAKKEQALSSAQRELEKARNRVKMALRELRKSKE